jgi:hypothetical protein
LSRIIAVHHRRDGVLSWLAMVVEIRQAIARDLARINEIERLAYSTPWTLKSFERELTLPFSKILVADLKERNSGSDHPVADGWWLTSAISLM